MSDLDARLDLAKSLFGGNPSQSTATVKGTVMSDSSSGSVSVKIGEVEYDEDGNIIVPESDLIATIPIIGSATTGDEVTVIVEDGSPTAIAAPGWGDTINDKTQHITFVSTGADAGLHIHEDASSYDVDGDLHLHSGGLEIRDNGSVLSSFGASLIELGKNAHNAAIKMLDNAGTICAYIVNGAVQTFEMVSTYGVHLSTKDYAQPGSGNVASIDIDSANASLTGADTYNSTTLEVTPTGVELNNNPLFQWDEITTATNQTAKTIDLTGYSEVMVVADVTRNGALHTFANSFPIQALGNSAHEYKIGGYVGSSGTTGGAWVSLSKTSFQAVGCFINSVDMQSGSYSTQWTVYAR